MNIKKLIYYTSKFTLLDEVLGFLYWVFAIYGIYLITESINDSVILIGILCLYVILIVIVYFTILKKVKYFFKPDGK